MGHIYVEAVLRGARRERRVRMLVDTGATYTIIPPELADDIGLVRLPFRTEVVLADGRRAEVEAGIAELSAEGRRAPVTVLVMPIEEPLLGSESLEALGLKPNPETGRLEPTRGYAVRA
ncbi:hypothetical protein B6U66_01800 [Candidatus Bathyarchaeota archaeon ex4484_135]|nr:MAG: hypothetical protein B6U66_01800 [Candidatus Bathyarchaeota archaeon ex4484_135]